MHSKTENLRWNFWLVRNMDAQCFGVSLCWEAVQWPLALVVINVFAYLQFNWGRALCMLVLFSPLPHSSCPITNWSLAIKSVNSFFSKIRQSQITILFIAYDTQQHRWIKILSQHPIIRVVASTKDRININSNANVSIMFMLNETLITQNSKTCFWGMSVICIGLHARNLPRSGR